MLTRSPLPITQPLPGSPAEVTGRLERTDHSKLHLIPQHSHLLSESQSTHGLNPTHEANQGPDPMYIAQQPQIPSYPGSDIFVNRRDQRQTSGNTGLPAAARRYRKKISRGPAISVGTNNSYSMPGWGGTSNELVGLCPQLWPAPPIQAVLQATKLLLLMHGYVCAKFNFFFFLK